MVYSGEKEILMGEITLSSSACIELRWWENTIMTSSKSLYDTPQISSIVFTDASNIGWGVIHGKLLINGRWSLDENTNHINYLESLAIKLAIKSFRGTLSNHVRIMSDNATAICYINKMGGIKSLKCDQIAKEIWEFAIANKIWISAAHIPGVENTEADEGSRKFFDAVEWSVSNSVFEAICSLVGSPDIDLFATRLNKKLPKYVSWKPDPGSTWVDGLFHSMERIIFIAFPPFSMIWGVVKKQRWRAKTLS